MAWTGKFVTGIAERNGRQARPAPQRGRGRSRRKERADDQGTALRPGTAQSVRFGAMLHKDRSDMAIAVSVPHGMLPQRRSRAQSGGRTNAKGEPAGAGPLLFLAQPARIFRPTRRGRAASMLEKSPYARPQSRCRVRRMIAPVKSRRNRSVANWSNRLARARG